MSKAKQTLVGDRDILDVFWPRSIIDLWQKGERNDCVAEEKEKKVKSKAIESGLLDLNLDSKDTEKCCVENGLCGLYIQPFAVRFRPITEAPAVLINFVCLAIRELA